MTNAEQEIKVKNVLKEKYRTGVCNRDLNYPGGGHSDSQNVKKDIQGGKKNLKLVTEAL